MIMDTWRTWYRYQAVVRLGAVKPITCPQCGVPLTPLLGEDDEVVLWCITEDSEIVPGTQFWADVRSVANEFNLE